MKRPPVLPEHKAPPEMLTLRLGDFLDRIPAELLEDGEHDRSIPLTFELAPLSERIGRGDTKIPVTDIFQRVPDIFRANVMNTADDVIRFPWNKVLTLIEETRAGTTATGLTPSGLEMLSLKLKARNLIKATRAAAAPCLRNAAPAGTAKSVAASAPSLAEPPPTVADRAVVPASAPELEQIVQEHQRQLAAMTAERDQAVAEIAPLREKLAKHLEQSALERRLAAVVSERLSLLEKGGDGETDPIIEALKTERDAAVARAAEFGIEHDAAISRIGEIMAERDAAIARLEAPAPEPERLHGEHEEQLAALAAERDQAVAAIDPLRQELARHLEQAAAERRVAAEVREQLSSLQKAQGEIDRTIEALKAERDAELARAAKFNVERDEALAGAEQLRADADAAFALATELTAERDAALARTTERTALPESPEPAATPANEPQSAAWESRAIASLEADIESYRKRIQTLLDERAALPAAPAMPVPDAYSTLFQPRFRLPRAAAALVLGLLGIGIVILSLITPGGADGPAATPANAAPSFTMAAFEIPALPEIPFTLESPAHEQTVTLLAAGETLPPIR